jgi:adenine-specific DNA-methyltransferase
MEKLNKSAGQSMDIVAANIAKLKELFPEIRTENKIDFKTLQTLLGEEVETDDERYSFNWHGKAQARQLAQTTSTGTLRPCKEDSVDWDVTQNLFIEGDNLEVLKLLQKSYHKQVKLIYIDPPYNTGKDFVYPDNFRDNIKNYLELTGQLEGGRKISSNTEASGRFHSDWLNMMYPRLKLARNLLREDGVLMVSIDDAEVDNMKSLCAEIYGEENILAMLIWNKQHSQQQGVFKRYHEYVIVIAKNAALIGNISGGEGEIDAGALKKISAANPASTFNFPAGVRFDATDGVELIGTYGDSEKVTVVSGRLVCKNGRTEFPVTLSAGWTQKNQMTSWFSGLETYDTKDQKVVEFYLSGTGKLKCIKERSKITPPSLLPEYGMVSEQTGYLEQMMGVAVFQNPKPVKMIADFVSWFANSDDLVLDFFSGSGTTGESVLRVNSTDNGNCRYILVQLPEPLSLANKEQENAAKFCDDLGVPRTIAELTKERLRRTTKKIKEERPDYQGDLGFKVFKLDSSNLKPWDADFDSLANDLAEATEVVKAERSAEDVLFEILLKYGLDLTLPIATHTLEGKTVYEVGAGALVVCLDSGITEAVAEAIGKLKETLEPEVMRVVFKDSGFANDAAKVNTVQVLKQFGIDDVKSI